MVAMINPRKKLDVNADLRASTQESFGNENSLDYISAISKKENASKHPPQAAFNKPRISISNASQNTHNYNNKSEN